MSLRQFSFFLGIQTTILSRYWAIVYSRNVDIPQANMLIKILLRLFVYRGYGAHALCKQKPPAARLLTKIFFYSKRMHYREDDLPVF